MSGADCPFATEDWYCRKPAGHDGPHESVPIGNGAEHGRVLTVRVANTTLSVPDDQVTTLIVCSRSGSDPVSCGLSACENGCRDVELTFVRAEILDD